MAKTYGVGIMGAGNISSAYLRLAPLFRNLEVRGVADVLPEAAQKRAEEFGVKAHTPDELLKNSEIDVVVNLTIPATHFNVSKDILSAGKHAYSEKPLVLSLEAGELCLYISDDGRGFSPSERRGSSFGLVGMRERVLMLGGRLSIDSQPGEGTTLRVCMFLDKEEAA